MRRRRNPSLADTLRAPLLWLLPSLKGCYKVLLRAVLRAPLLDSLKGCCKGPACRPFLRA
jgi:hypothetical protein